MSLETFGSFLDLLVLFNTASTVLLCLLRRLRRS